MNTLTDKPTRNQVRKSSRATGPVPVTHLPQSPSPGIINPYPAIGDMVVVTRNFLGTTDKKFCLAKVGTSPALSHEIARVTLGKGGFVRTYTNNEVKDFADFGCGIVAMAPLDTLPMNRDDYRPMTFFGFLGLMGWFGDSETRHEVKNFDGAIFTDHGCFYKPPTT